MLLELEGVRKTFIQPDGRIIQILKDISLQVKDGESMAIIGPSGSGKTTLLNMIGALDSPTSGSVMFDGFELSQCGESELSKLRNEKIGFVFQKHYLLPQLSILENALVPTLPLHSAQSALPRAKQLFDRVGLAERMGHRPGQLSLGECQRAAFVRALINQPKLLLADEPTGSLDTVNADQLGQLLLELNQEQKTALIVATHALPLAKKMRTVYRLENGVLEKSH